MRDEYRSIGISAGLILVNVVLMGVIGVTPLADAVLQLFSTLILGVIVYGAVLTAGTYLAEQGVKGEDPVKAVAGVLLLQVGYGSFGGALLGLAPPSLFIPILTATAVITVIIASAAAALVYGTGRDFSSFRQYASYLFIGVLVTAFIGTFTAPVAILAFVMALAGFLCLLVYELWETRKDPDKIWLNGVGIYNAFMGVFVHILRIVIQLWLSRE